MRGRRVLGFCWALAGILAAPLRAQTPDARVATGDRIRYRLQDGSKGKVTVLGVGADWMKVQRHSGEAVRRIEKADLASLHLWAGRRRHPVEGALLGLGVGAACGYGLAQALCDYGSDCDSGQAMLVMGAMGSVLGAGVGALIRSDRWREVSPTTVRFGILPARGGGVRVALRLSF